MYIVTIKNAFSEPIEIHNEFRKLSSGSVSKGINSIDSFTFDIAPSNIGFNELHDFTTLVDVYNTNKARYEFQGRILCINSVMTESGAISKEVVCESFLGYLCDSVQDYVEERSWSLRDFFDHVIATHNNLVEDEKAFIVRSVMNSTDYIECSIDRENTFETIKKKILDELGGEIKFEVTANGIYLDYVAQIGELKTTPISLSRNMKSITRERDPSEYITRLIPLGEKEEDGEERLDISSINSGKKYIDDARGIEQYGVHVGVVEFDDISDATTLLTAGKKWLAENNAVKVKYSVTALDLSLLGLDIDDFDIGNSHPIKNHLLGIDDTARIIKKTINISEEIKGSIEIGEKFKTLTEIQRDQKREAAEAVKVIKQVNGNYVAKNAVVSTLNASSEVVNLQGNRLLIESEKFGMTPEGVITAKAGFIGGFTITDSYISKNKPSYADTSQKGVYIGVDGIGLGYGDFFVKDTGELFAYSASIWGKFTSESEDGNAVKIEDGYIEMTQSFGSSSNTRIASSVWDDFSNGTVHLSFGIDPNGRDHCWISASDGMTDGIGMYLSKTQGQLYGTWLGTSSVAITSDANKKHDITDITEAYNVLFDNLKPRLFRYNDGQSNRLHVGFIAQEVEAAIEAAGLTTQDFAAFVKAEIITKETTETVYLLRYEEFVALNTLQIQKLKEKAK